MPVVAPAVEFSDIAESPEFAQNRGVSRALASRRLGIPLASSLVQMKKTFLFMTGAHQYRLHASSWQEAFETAIHELKPDRNTRDVIRSTLREDGDTRWLVKAHAETAGEALD